MKNIFQSIDNFLNATTMYRVVLYYLEFLLVSALVLSLFGVLQFSAISLVVSTMLILIACWTVNTVTAYVFGVQENIESTFITAFILALVITPPDPSIYFSYIPFLLWASALAMMSKFIFVIRKKHIFNPAALSMAVMAFAVNQSASWWVGTAWMIPFTLAGGILVVQKIRRWDLATAFFAAAAFSIIGAGILRGANVLTLTQGMLIHSPILFFAFVMITEPLTTPPTRMLRIYYGALVGLLFSPAVHIGSVYSTPELALLAGNIFSYAVSPKQKLILKLKERIAISENIYDFIFTSSEPLKFRAGQYLEWTLGHLRPDNRGVRRYFTVASSPTEPEIRVGVKFYQSPSSFKKALGALYVGDEIVASHLAGDFTLPADTNKKLAFIAGGIGVTPFRSMIKYMLDTDEKRDAILLYSNKTVSEVAYKEIFDKAEIQLGLRTIYTIDKPEENMPSWCCGGFITAEMIAQDVPDYKERIFYISGPQSMVTAFKNILTKMGVQKKSIRTDFFPGFV